MKVDFSSTIGKITNIEKAKNKKRNEMKKMYNSLVNNQEMLDILMLQLGKNIEKKFPGLEFRLISRIKTEKSFYNKLENDLSNLSEITDIENLCIYDIMALSVIVEKVPNIVKSAYTKNDASYDENFDKKISDLIDARNATKISMEKCDNLIKEKNEEITKKEKNKTSKIEQKNINDDIIEKASSELKEYLKKISFGYKHDIDELQKDITKIKSEIHELNCINNNNENILSKQEDECNRIVANFIVEKMSTFENIKALDMKDIPNRLKSKEKYNGYRALHNSFEMVKKEQDENGKQIDFRFMCEVQGKSLDAFYIADRGIAAQYHIKPETESQKNSKNKDLPDIMNINTEKEKKQFREYVKKNVPVYRMYRHTKFNKGVPVGEPEIYKLSTKEGFMLYYYNQLLGNEILGIKPDLNKTKHYLKSETIQEGDSKRYNKFEYKEL